MVGKMERYKYAPLLVFQFILMILYFIFAKYGGDTDVNVRGYEDTHVMIFIGFAYLMTFLKRYCYSAIGFNWFLAALVVQWALLCQNFFHMKDLTIYISKKSLLEADIMSATVLITFGVVLGLASGTQLFFLAIVETAIGCTNLWLMEYIYKATDIGGSMAIHTFGAYFGIGASWALTFKKHIPDPPLPRLDGPSYNSDITAILGSLFLWVFWPSFNSGLANTETEYQRAVINTYLSLAAATVTAFIMSSMLSHEKGKFDMVHIQNSTLAGGVGVGAVANLFISPGGAIAIGIGAGFLSVVGYKYVTPCLETHAGIVDTCGVNNLHGMPGVYSGLLSILFAWLARPEQYGEDYGHIFEAMTEDGRSRTNQAFFQAAALLTSIFMGIAGGFLCGLIANTRLFKDLKEDEQYNDALNWAELPPHV